MPEFNAHVVLGESLTPVGQLRFTQAGPRQFSTFAYDPAWIENPRAFALQPTFPLEAGPFHTSGQPGNMRDALAGVFADAAPDSWGRRLLERTYGNGLSEFEYLTLSDDACRQGALRFVDDGRKIIRGGAADAVPRLVDLEAITAIARAYEQGKEISAEDMQALVGAGGSGGARPKANVRDGDTLWLAKFTSVHDQHPIECVEVATLRLARACGIRTPEVRLELADTPFPVALIKRFDRRGPTRVPYISARTALGKTGAELGSYTEIVDFMRANAADPQADFREIFLRLIFTILVSNKDDHLKNHGFLYVGAGRWRLSPVFDVNPAPDRNPHLETSILEGGAHDRSIRLAFEACEFFEMHQTDARQMIRETAQQISMQWRDALRHVGVSGPLAREYEAAFVNDQTEIALDI
ncbi:type II toxin-antitoxin system HipA family toxin [Rhizobium leguminosarum]|uniref:type II toxin-antitoxin system HipA family toxin n=1 Tax=Rhizobium TaxID=379 RepID=UPI0013B9FA7D|nr:type II toxin-antitoxin system HipA family toxin [Rhizobium leguminosarum]MBY5389723.1 type II toxin-antitoxin system HipA family toxin [Rhizobium leguminosarum]MBY5432927.1 type II toxin-antitoxin system HipA family toxin [Rhizobium leguminosarum]NEK44480.1 type II toxin-antitoxin system HipA family toxin [Rhizobium leguminosarum]